MAKADPIAPLIIGGVDIAAGESRTIDLPLSGLYTHAEISMPVQVLRGKRAGPTLFVSAALHGDEINGVEIIRRVLKLPELKSLRGSLIAVPIVNVLGFLQLSRYLPDRRDLNRSFPGSARGSLAGRLAYLFGNEIVAKADAGIDLHTAAIHRDNLPQIRGDFDDERNLAMAAAFGAPVMMHSDLLEGSLRQFAGGTCGIPIIVYEAGEALRFDETAIRGGVRGVRNVMRELGMLPARRRAKPVEPAVARSSSWQRAPISGILRANVPLGARVKKDQRLAIVSDPFGETEEEIIAPSPGVVIGRTNLPLVHEGEAVFHIAKFGSSRSAAEQVESFQVHTEENPPLSPEAEPPIL